MSIEKTIYFGNSTFNFPSSVNFISIVKGDVYGYNTKIELENGLIKEMTSIPIFITYLPQLFNEESKIFNVSETESLNLFKEYNLET